MTNEEISEQVLEVLKDFGALTIIEQLTPYDKFVEETGMDSLDASDYLMRLEKRYGITFPDKMFEEVKTMKLNDLVEEIKRLTDEKTKCLTVRQNNLIDITHWMQMPEIPKDN